MAGCFSKDVLKVEKPVIQGKVAKLRGGGETPDFFLEARMGDNLSLAAAGVVLKGGARAQPFLASKGKTIWGMITQPFGIIVNRVPVFKQFPVVIGVEGAREGAKKAVKIPDCEIAYTNMGRHRIQNFGVDSKQLLPTPHVCGRGSTKGSKV